MRLRQALSLRGLAAASGVAFSTIAKIESGGQAHPSTVRKLADALKCQPADLMDEDQD